VENESTAVIGGKDGKTHLIKGVPIYHLGCITKWEIKWCRIMVWHV
jgi:hypothetical protein